MKELVGSPFLCLQKKIIDNIPSDSPLYPTKQKFFKLYSENIQMSFRDIMKELNVSLDKNGNLTEHYKGGE